MTGRERPAETPSRTVSITIRRPLAEVYDFAANPEHLPRWSFLETVTRKEGAWEAKTPDGAVGLRFVSRNEHGVLDHWVRLADGSEVYAPMRVIANGSGSEVVFTVFQLTGMDDASFARDVATVERDLAALKNVLENGD